MKPYRDAVTRISIRQIRAQFAPKKFATLEEVLVKAGDASTVVKIARVPSTTAHGGMRRWLLCPRCGSQTSVVGLISGAAGCTSWACFGCAAWTSRRINRAPRRQP